MPLAIFSTLPTFPYIRELDINTPRTSVPRKNLRLLLINHPTHEMPQFKKKQRKQKKTRQNTTEPVTAQQATAGTVYKYNIGSDYPNDEARYRYFAGTQRPAPSPYISKSAATSTIGKQAATCLS